MRRKPKLGQNFLVSNTAQRAIVDALGPLAAQTVVEIGPGKAAITELLATRAKRLVAIELDDTLAPALRTRFAMSNQASGFERVEVIHQDVLTVDLTALATRIEAEAHAIEQTASPNTARVNSALKMAVIGNLPYYITSDILLHLFAHHAVLSRAILMVQREVGDRIVAEPGTRDYGMLSATCQLYARTERLFTLPPEAFSPAPAVHSSVVRLDFAPRLTELAVAREPFLAYLRQSYAQKRKTLANNLRAAGYPADALGRAFPIAGINPQARAETLTLAEQARLFHVLRKTDQ